LFLEALDGDIETSAVHGELMFFNRIFFCFSFISIFFSSARDWFRVWYMLGECSTTELHTQPLNRILKLQHFGHVLIHIYKNEYRHFIIIIVLFRRARLRNAIAEWKVTWVEALVECSGKGPV
jgi:hypothetical protein